MSAWWIPPSDEPVMILEVPERWNGLIENEEDVIALVDLKLNALFREARADATGDGMWDLRQGLETLERHFGLSLHPETVRGIDITAELRHRLLALCREDETPLTFPQRAMATEDADPRETFSEWVDRLVS
jgi:hypothetical protein